MRNLFVFKLAWDFWFKQNMHNGMTEYHFDASMQSSCYGGASDDSGACCVVCAQLGLRWARAYFSLTRLNLCLRRNECIPSPECIEYITLSLNSFRYTGNVWFDHVRILTLCERESKACGKSVSSQPDFLQNDGNHLRWVNFFLHNTWPSTIFFGFCLKLFSMLQCVLPENDYKTWQLTVEIDLIFKQTKKKFNIQVYSN